MPCVGPWSWQDPGDLDKIQYLSRYPQDVFELWLREFEPWAPFTCSATAHGLVVVSWPESLVDLSLFLPGRLTTSQARALIIPPIYVIMISKSLNPPSCLATRRAKQSFSCSLPKPFLGDIYLFASSWKMLVVNYIISFMDQDLSSVPMLDALSLCQLVLQPYCSII